MSKPHGFETIDASFVCKLYKALYGLKQTPRAWYQKLTQSLVQFGFFHSKCDHSLFIYSHQDVIIYVLMYENNILITSSSSTLVHKLIDSLHDKFALKKLGILEYFIGIKILHLASWNLFLTQTKYIRDLLTKSNMINANSVTTPMLRNCRLGKHGALSLSDPHLYRSMVGALKYVTFIRPNVAFIVNKACQFMVSPLTHW